MTTGMPDFSALLAQAQQMQQQMMDAQQGLADLEVEGSSGGGLVTAVVDGTGDLRSLTIHDDAYDPDDPDALATLADLVVAAVRDAKTEVERRATERMTQAASGLAEQTGLLGSLLGGGLPDVSGLPQHPGPEDEPGEPGAAPSDHQRPDG
jgi:hypothetical protein